MSSRDCITLGDIFVQKMILLKNCVKKQHFLYKYLKNAEINGIIIMYTELLCPNIRKQKKKR